MTKEWWQLISPKVHIELLRRNTMEDNTKKEVDFIETRTLLSTESMILDLCCGNGRHSIELAKRGYKVFGLDYTRGLLDMAKESNIDEAEFVQGNMIALPFPNEYFGLTISMWQSVGYFQAESENEHVFLEVSRVLHKDGFFVLQVNNPLYVIAHLAVNGQLNDNGTTILEENEVFSSGIVEKFTSFDPRSFRYKSKRGWNIETEKREVTHDMRYYTLPELKKIFANCNLSINKVFGSLGGEPYTLLSKQIIIVAQKK